MNTMEKESLAKAILKLQPDMSEKELERGLTFFHPRSTKAKAHVLQAGEVCDSMYFAEHSIVRCHYETPKGEDHTLWMKPEQTFITEYKSFVHQEPSMFSLQFYEDTLVFSIKRSDLLGLYATSTEWALFGIHLTENVHVTLIDVFVNLLSNDATRNYQYIAYAFPRFLQVAPLKDIASMLQVSPVSLSRIRAGKQVKT